MKRAYSSTTTPVLGEPKKIVLLEAIRHCSKTESIKNLYYYINRILIV